MRMTARAHSISAVLVSRGSSKVGADILARALDKTFGGAPLEQAMLVRRLGNYFFTSDKLPESLRCHVGGTMGEIAEQIIQYVGQEVTFNVEKVN